MERGYKATEEGPGGLKLIIDTEDEATPAMVSMRVGREEHTATFDCATGEGELDCGAYQLTTEQLAWLDQFSDDVAEAYDVARAGNPAYG